MSITSQPVPNSALKDYLDVAGDLPTDVLLGRIVLFKITDEPIAHDNLVLWFDELNLDKRYLPGQIRDLDAFKKATSESEGESYPLPRGQFASILCREVAANNDLVKRQITREIRDAGRKVLTYHAAIDCTFYRGDAGRSRLKIMVRAGDPGITFEDVKPLEGIQEKIVDRFHRYRNFHDGQKLRATVRNYLKHLNAIEIKGGVYFIHASKDDELSRLSELVDRFGGGCSLNTIPMVNLKKDREFIAAQFEREASQALQEITKEALDVAKSNKRITPATYARIKERYDEVLENANEHMVTLEVSQDLTAASAEVALDALQRLQREMVKELANS